MQRGQGFAQQGGELVYTAGIASTTQVQESLPFSTITVYQTGTTRLAALYADNHTPPTPLANPFTANIDGYWYFYAANGRYDVMITSPDGSVYPWTMGDLLLFDPSGGGGAVGSQTPWLSNIDGGGFNLTNVGFIDVTGGYLVNGVPMSNPNLWVPVANSSSIYHQGFIGVINQAPKFAVDVQGGVNVTDNYYINGVAISGGSGGGGPWVVLGASQINYSGHVGISNTNPQYSLDVNGSINVSTGNNFFINGVAISAGSGGGPWTVLSGNRITYAGQVGIGNSSPGYPLDVLGDVNITGAYRVNGTPIGGGGGQWISGSGGVIYYNGGNVGIGVAAPTTTLAVNGSISSGTGTNASNAVIAHGDIVCDYSIQCQGQVIGSAFALVGGWFFTTAVGTGATGVNLNTGAGNLTLNPPAGTSSLIVNGTSCIDSTGIYGGKGVQTASDVDGGRLGITGYGFVIDGTGTFVGAGVNTTGAITCGNNTNTNQLTVNGDIKCTQSLVCTGQVTASAYAMGPGFFFTSAPSASGVNISAGNGSVNAASFSINGGQVINSSATFTGNGGVSVGSASVNCGAVNASSFYTNGGAQFGTLNVSTVNNLGTVNNPVTFTGNVNFSSAVSAGGNPGQSFNISWYGSSNGSTFVGVLHTLTVEFGIVTAIT